jgi:hypothetical protein
MSAQARRLYMATTQMKEKNSSSGSDQLGFCVVGVSIGQQDCFLMVA